jgi:glutamate-1-semialdehyde 2,1-aminomutase
LIINERFKAPPLVGLSFCYDKFMQTIARTRSQELFKRAKELMPGGVNSPVRAFKSIGIDPIFIKSAKGAYLFDEDGNKYIDFVGSWGPMILGHADPDIEAAIIAAARSGTSFGAPTALENQMAEEVIKLVPSIEMVRFVNSGTEAVMAAIRLARAFTKRDKIIKFTGCYHGHCDALLVSAGSGVATLGLPDSPGVTKETAKDTLVVKFNDQEALKKVFEKHSSEIAAIITEPIIGNSGFIKAQNGFLELCRELCNEHQSLLIFDEVMTGFRVALGGAQELFGIKADITTLGKVIGGGLPVGAYGGSQEIMSMVAPAGPMYQAGTLSGNPLAMSAGLTCLKKIQAANFYQELEAKTKYLVEGIKAIDPANIQVDYAGGMFGYFFSPSAIDSYEAAKENVDIEKFKSTYKKLLDLGVYMAPSAFEAGFVSAAHSYEDLDKVIEAMKISL